MKRITLTIGAIIMIATFSQLKAQDEDAMKKWMDYMTPGEIHKMLSKDDGEWNEEITMWMAPGAPATKSTATAMNKMILGGRYQHSSHKGNFNGMPFEGISIVGYDNAKKMIVSSWVDNMGTGMMYMEGTWDPATKTVSLKGRAVDPMTGKEKDMRQTVKYIDENTQQMEMFDTQDGKEYKNMEIKLTRKK